MGNKILKLATLKSSNPLHMQQLREGYDKVLNAAKDNGTTETIEELEKLHQIMEEKRLCYRNCWLARYAYGTTKGIAADL